jgi:hypothetical protein
MIHDSPILPRLLALNTLLAAPALAQMTYKHYRFEPVRLYANGNTIQLSEFTLSNGGTRLNLIANNPEIAPPAVGQNGTAVDTVPVTVTGGSRLITDAQGAPAIVDGATATKWLSFITNNGGEDRFLYFDFTAPVTIDTYNFATGADTATFPSRNPVDWQIWGRNAPEDAWILIDRVLGFPADPRNEVFQQEFPLTGEAAPLVNSYALSFGSFPIVRDGDAVGLEWDTFDVARDAYPESLSITPAIGGAPLEGTDMRMVTPPAGSDTDFTLTATNGSRSTSRQLTVRSVAGGSASHRFFRFTPVATRPGANGHQLAEISFFNGGTELNLIATNAAVPPAAGSTGTADNLVNVIVTNPGGTQAANAPLLVDGLSNTKLFDAKANPVIFEFEQAVAIDSYRFTTANDFEARDPVRWTLEGSDDGITWALVDNVTAFAYPTPTGRFQQSQVFPLPGASLDPDVVTPPPSEWTGFLNTNYDVAFNWSTGVAPGLLDEVVVATGNAIRGGNLERNGRTTVADGGTLTVNGRLLNRGDFRVEGGLLKQAGNYFIAGINSAGTIRHSGGTVEATHDRGFFLSDDGPAAGSRYLLSGTGQLAVSSTGNGNTSLGGSVLHNVHLGKGGAGDLFEISGGQAAFTSTNNNFVYLSRNSTLRISGGSASFAGYSGFLVGFEGAGDNLLEISGGTVAITGTQLLVGGGSTGAVTLSGGSLTLDQAIGLGQSNANGTFTMTGGTLAAANLTSTARGSFTFSGGEIFLAGDRRGVIGESWFSAAPGTTASYDATLNRTRIAVTAAGPFAAWVATGGIPADLQGPADDPDFDGVSNLLEFALAGLPGDPGSHGIHTPVAAPGAALLTVAVRAGATFAPDGGRLAAVIDGLRYEIQGSTDLGRWDEPVEEVIPAVTAGVAAPPAEDWELRSFRLAGTAAANGFLRVEVGVAP